MQRAREPSTRELEKRYGDVKDLIRRRGEELGANMSSRMDRIDDAGRIGRHMSVYDGTEMGLIATSIRNIVNLYSIEVNGSSREAHVIWMFEDLREVTKNRYRYNSNFKVPREFDRLYRETYGDKFKYDKLPRKILDAIYNNPDTVPRIEEFLLGAYAKALEFHDWRFIPDGLVITGARNIMYAPLYHSFLFDNDALGIGIGNSILHEMILYVDPSEYHKLETSFVATFVHELTHFHRMDITEVSEFAISLLFDPKENAINLLMLRDNLSALLERQERLPDHDVLRHVDNYEVQRYIGIILAANEFAKSNRAIRKLFREDESPNKLNAVRDFVDLIRNSDIERVKKSGFVEALLDGDVMGLIEHIDIIDE